MSHFSKLGCLILIACMMTFAHPAPAEQPVVHAVLSWSDTCPHCHYVMENVLPPLQAHMGQSDQSQNLVLRHARSLIEQDQALQSLLFEAIGLGLALQTADGDEIKGAFQQRLEVLRQQLLRDFTTDHLRQRFEQRLHQWLNHAA